MTFLKACRIILNGKKRFKEHEYFRVASEEIVRKEIAEHDVIFFNPEGIHYDFKLLLNARTIHFNKIGEMLYGKD